MFALVFSCTTMSTVAGNSTLPLTWSPCVCVLISSVTGLGVSSLILSRIGCAPAGVLRVHDRDAVRAVTKTAVLPPPPFNMNRLSLIFSTSTTLGPCCAGACTPRAASDAAAIAISVPTTIVRLIGFSRQA